MGVTIGSYTYGVSAFFKVYGMFMGSIVGRPRNTIWYCPRSGSRKEGVFLGTVFFVQVGL